MKVILATFAALLSLWSPVVAWSGPGHAIVAAIAYQDLNAGERKQLLALLSHHPDFQKWKSAVLFDDPSIDLNVVPIMGASRWPDDIKLGHTPWNHRDWHFVRCPAIAPEFPVKPSPNSASDLPSAVDLATQKLRIPAVSLEDKACWMCWLIHLVGDIHQPLHCATLITEKFTAPDGDNGGDLSFVRVQAKRSAMSLHALWDQVFGAPHLFHHRQVLAYIKQATKLSSQLRRTDAAELAAHQTPQQWARESWQVAVDQAYLRGTLKSSALADSAPVLPDGYTGNLESIAARRVTLAGYRLADLIRGVLTVTPDEHHAHRQPSKAAHP